MNKFLTKIIGASLAIAMMIGVGVGTNANKNITRVDADTGTLNVNASDLGYTNTTYSNKSGIAVGTEGFKFSTTDVCKESGKTNFQLKKTSGVLWNSDCPAGYTITSIELTNKSGGTVSVYKGNSAKPSTSVTGTNNVYPINSVFFKIANPSSAAYFSLVINYDDGQSSFGTLDHIKVSTNPDKVYFEVGETFSSSGLALTGYDAADENNAHTQIYTSGFTTDYDNHVFEVGDIGQKSVEVTYGTKKVSYSITVGAAPDFVHTYASNSVFGSTTYDKTQTVTHTPTSGPEYITLGGYNYTNGTTMSFPSTSGMYFGNNEEYTVSSDKKYISKIVIETNADVSNKVQMTEGPVVLSESTTITPTLSNDNQKLTYVFSGENPFFKFKSTANSYINMTSVKVYLGSTIIPAEITGVSASIKSGTYVTGTHLSASDFNVTVSWSGNKEDTHPNSDFTWTVNGVLNGVLSEGDNIVVVTYQEVSSDEFVVVAETIHASSVSITEATANVDVGKNITLHGSISPANAVDSISWSTSNGNIATVSNAGVVTGVAPGVVTITATANNHSATCVVTVFKMIDFGEKNYSIAKPASSQTELSTVTFGGYTFNTLNAHNNAGGYEYMMLACKDFGNTLLSNKTPVPGFITKIIIKTTNTGSEDAVYNAAISDEEITSPVTSEAHSLTGNGTITIEAQPSDGIRFFAISCKTSVKKNGQIRSVQVCYVEPTAETTINTTSTQAALSYTYSTPANNPSAFENVAIRFGGQIEKTVWSELNGGENGTNILGYGVMLATNNYLQNDTIKGDFELMLGECGSFSNTFEEINGVSFVKGTEIKNFYNTVSTAPAEQGNCYLWNLYKGIKNTEAGLTKGFTAVAYINTVDGVVFFKETSTSAADLANAMNTDNPELDTTLEGSLSYLAGLAQAN